MALARRDWAYALCVVSFAGLLVYLFYLHCQRATDPAVAANVGTELDVATAVVAVYAIVMTIPWRRLRRHHQRSADVGKSPGY